MASKTLNFHVSPGGGVFDNIPSPTSSFRGFDRMKAVFGVQFQPSLRFARHKVSSKWPKKRCIDSRCLTQGDDNIQSPSSVYPTFVNPNVGEQFSHSSISTLVCATQNEL